jgi:hypothetical protein
MYINALVTPVHRVPLLMSIRLEFRKVLPTDMRRSGVQTVPSVRMRRYVLTMDLVFEAYLTSSHV